MKAKSTDTTYFFVDESGDPFFYDRHGNMIVGSEGCSKLLILGFIKSGTPDQIRKSVEAVRREVSEDPYLKPIPSVRKSVITKYR